MAGLRYATVALGALALVGAGACDGAPPPAVDAGIDASAPDLLRIDAGALPPLAIAPPAPPAEATPPAPPELGPCATGWVEADGICRPALDDAPACPAGEHAFATGCARVGSACPADGWPADLPTDRAVVYVAPGGGFGAGTREEPLGLVSTALARLGGGGVVALSVGTHREDELWLDGTVEVRGACAEGTRIESLTEAQHNLVTLVGSSSLRDVTVSAANGPAIVIDVGPTDARVGDVVVDGGRAAGVLVVGGAHALVERVVVRGIEPLEAWGGATNGVWADRGGVITLRTALIEALDGPGLTVAASTADARDVTIRGTREHAVDPFSACVGVWGGGTLRLSEALLEGCPTGGVVAGGDATHVELDASLVRDTPGQTDGARGAGVLADRASIIVRRSAFLRNRSAGIHVDRGTLDVEDAFVGDTLPSRDGSIDGQGILLGTDVEATVSRVQIERARTAGVTTGWGGGNRLRVADLTVRAPRRAPGGGEGSGVNCLFGSACVLERVLVEDADGRGVEIAGEVTGSDLVVSGVRVVPRGGPGTGIQVVGTARLERVRVERASSEAIKVWGDGDAVLSDVVLRATQPDRFLILGNGLWVTQGGHLELTRALVEDMRFSGIHLDGVHPEMGFPSSAVLSDVVIRRVSGDDLLGFFGNGVRASSGTTALRRVVIEDARETALVAFGAGTLVDAEDVEIVRTRMRACTERELDPCATDIAGGCGITAFNEGAVSLLRFRSAENALCGVMIAPGATITLTDGEIARNPIGANVQVPDYDLARLSDGVRYVDNDRNYDGATLPVPDDAPPSF